MVSKPGELTSRYLQGKRASQLPPIRTYLVFSLLIFLFSPPMAIGDPSARNFYFDGQPVGEIDPNRGTSGIPGIDLGAAPASWFPERARVAKARLASIQDPHILHDVLRSRFASIMPNIMLALLPITGLLLAGLYWNQRKPLFEHLLFTIHFQSLILLLILVLTTLDRLVSFIGSNGVSWRLMDSYPLWIALTLFLSLRRVYGETWLRCLLKGTLVLAFYALFTQFGLKFVYQATLLTV